MKAFKPILLGIVFVAVHAWALNMLWMHGPPSRRVLLVAVYFGTLVGSGLITKRFRPPLMTSLILFSVVLAWRLIFAPGTSWI